MARMHTRRKGKSGSKHPSRIGKPDFVTYEEAEIEELIVKLLKEEKSPSMIGLILRDQYGIPSVRDVTGKKIGYYIAKNNMSTKLPEDLTNLIITALSLRKHLSTNKKDLHNTRSLHLAESKILRLSKYYRKSGKLPENWRYDPESAKLLT
jgi:small subunit ribosomal protein S15